MISNILNGEFQNNSTVPFIGFPNQNCKMGLYKLGCEIKYVKNKFQFLEVLQKGYPILLKVCSQVLNYSYIYNEGTNRKHYIVAFQADDKRILISDSYVQTLPLSIYQGEINRDVIFSQFDNKNASGMVIIPTIDHKINTWRENYDLIKILDEYVLLNVFGYNNSICELMNKYCKYSLEHMPNILVPNNMEEMIYQMKFSGAIARWNYLVELFCLYYKINEETAKELNNLKSKWNIVVNKLRKCCITQNADYYQNVFKVDIPRLLEVELSVYKKIANLREIKK